MASIIRDAVARTQFSTSGGRRTTNEYNRVALGQRKLKEAGDGLNSTMASQSSIFSSVVGRLGVVSGAVFAVSGAFRGLASAAQVSQSLQGLESLAATSAQNGLSILNSVQGITKQQVAISDAVKSINLALSSGFSTEQIEGLSEVALRASKALGTTLQEAYGRVTRASAKLETELLDELGIYTKIEPAAAAYARTIGKTASELTEFERRQAFGTGVITEGLRKFGAINTTVDTTAETFNRLTTQVRDLGVNLGREASDFLAPFISEISNNTGVLAAGVALLLRSTVTRLDRPISRFTNDIGTRITAGLTRNIDTSFTTEAIQGLNVDKNIDKLLGSSGRQLGDSFRGYITKSFARPLTVGETREVNTLFDGYQNILFKNQRRLINTLKVLPDDAPETILLSKVLGRTEKAIIQSKRIASQLTDVDINAKNVSRLTRNMSRLADTGLVAGRALQGFGSILGKAFNFGPLIFAGSAFFANMIGRGTDFNDVLSNTGELLEGLFSTRFTRGRGFFTSIVDEELKNIESINDQFKQIENFRFTRRINIPFLGLDFGSISINTERTKKQLADEITNAISEIANDKQFLDNVFSRESGFGALSGAAVGAIVGSIVPGLGTVVGGTAGALGGAIVGGFTSYFSDGVSNAEIKEARKALASSLLEGLDEDTADRVATVFARISRARQQTFTPEGRQFYDAQLTVIRESVGYLNNLEAITRLTAITGQSSAAIARNYKFIQDTQKEIILEATTDGVFGQSFNISFINEGSDEVNKIYKNLSGDAALAARQVIESNDEITASAVRAIEVLRTAQEGVFTNISLEQFQKNLQDSRSAVASVQRDIVASLDKRIVLEKTVARLGEEQAIVGDKASFSNRARIVLSRQLEAGTRAELASATTLLDAETERTEQLREQVKLLELAVNGAERFEESVKRQEQLQDFIASFTGRNVNPYQGIIDSLTGAGIGNLQAFNIFGGDNLDDLKIYNRFLADVDSKLDGLNLDQVAVNLIEGASLQNIESTVRALSTIDGVTASIVGNTGRLAISTRVYNEEKGKVVPVTKEINLLSSRQLKLGQEIASVYQLQSTSASRLAGTLVDILLNENKRLGSATRGTKNALDDIKKELEDASRNSLLLQVQFNADINTLERDLDKVIQEATIENIELDKVIAETRLDSGLGNFERFKEISDSLIMANRELVSTQIRGLKDNLSEQKRLIDVQLRNDISTLLSEARLRKNQFDVERTTTLADIASRKTEIIALRDLNTEQREGLRTIFNAFGSSFAEVLEEGSAALGKAATFDFTDIKEIDETSVASTRALTILTDSEDEVNKLFDNLITRNREVTVLTINNLTREANHRKSLEEQQTFININELTESQILADRKLAIEREANSKLITDLNRKAEGIKTALGSIFDSIESNLSQAFQQLNDLYFFNEGLPGLTNDQSEKQIVSDLFKNVERDVFKSTIADPLSGFITDGVAGLFGITERRGIENAKVDIATGALLVKNVDDTFRQISPDLSSVFSFGSRLKNDTFGTLFNLLPRFASGGTIQRLAGGGQVRDRVPVLAEPGEFMLKSSAARQIGRPALNSMNATGRLPSAPNIEVNVINKGNSQEVESTSTRLQGDQYIIDVVTRDMQNNGRIRQQMKRG